MTGYKLPSSNDKHSSEEINDSGILKHNNRIKMGTQWTAFLILRSTRIPLSSLYDLSLKNCFSEPVQKPGAAISQRIVDVYRCSSYAYIHVSARRDGLGLLANVE